MFSPDASIIISDLHLGAINCQADAINGFLAWLPATIRLTIAGDLVDHGRTKTWPQSHRNLLARLIERAQGGLIIGNHDIGTEVSEQHEMLDRLILKAGPHKALIIHGHQWDAWLDAHPFLTEIGDRLYQFLQRIDASHRVARWAKRRCKAVLRVANAVKDGATESARSAGARIAICGHTHLAGIWAEGDTIYANSGSWAEKPPTFLTLEPEAVSLWDWEGRPRLVTRAHLPAIPSPAHDQVPLDLAA